MGRNGRAFYDRELSLSIGAKKFANVFKEVVALPLGMRSRQSGWRLWIKKVLDRGTALLALIVLSPVFLAASVLVWVSMGRPSCSASRGRGGLQGRLFCSSFAPCPIGTIPIRDFCPMPND